MPTPNCCRKFRLVLSKVKTDILVWLRAGDARLRHFKQRIANAASITDTDLIIGKSFDSEILGELAEVEITASKKLLPVMVGIHLIDENGTLLPTMPGEIRLRVTVDVQRAPFAVRRQEFSRSLFEPSAIPRHPAWKADAQ